MKKCVALLLLAVSMSVLAPLSASAAPAGEPEVSPAGRTTYYMTQYSVANRVTGVNVLTFGRQTITKVFVYGIGVGLELIKNGEPNVSFAAVYDNADHTKSVYRTATLAEYPSYDRLHDRWTFKIAGELPNAVIAAS
ncbi:hypothetical protein HPO96_20970 [Kribbella sandramycini]|uniref:Uncharacterized protein n=1 Tax=Kribbella sandramycini TaxID=60450 RepID=A0A7Y4L3W3_9ACTN|nr:hypothetical protein [Kribbella sandramycini]MBB6566624.1 hypothetical protein [Kribbella sandramycini]NOL42721.1 hypothetical protein [Kribbella sandramycini]